MSFTSLKPDDQNENMITHRNIPAGKYAIIDWAYILADNEKDYQKLDSMLFNNAGTRAGTWDGYYIISESTYAGDGMYTGMINNLKEFTIMVDGGNITLISMKILRRLYPKKTIKKIEQEINKDGGIVVVLRIRLPLNMTMEHSHLMMTNNKLLYIQKMRKVNQAKMRKVNQAKMRKVNQTKMRKVNQTKMRKVNQAKMRKVNQMKKMNHAKVKKVKISFLY